MPVIVVIYTTIIVVNYLSNEGSFDEFGDLGTLLLGGFLLAVAVAIALTFIRLRLREKKPPAAQFISINERTQQQKPDWSG